MAALSTGVATMTNLAHLRVQDNKEEKQSRCDDARLTESGKARREQLLMMHTEQLANQLKNYESVLIDWNI